MCLLECSRAGIIFPDIAVRPFGHRACGQPGDSFSFVCDVLILVRNMSPISNVSNSTNALSMDRTPEPSLSVIEPGESSGVRRDKKLWDIQESLGPCTSKGEMKASIKQK